MISIHTLSLRRLAIGLLFVLVVAACDWRGPNPTEQLLTASSGPFAVAQLAVPSSAGFGGGTIYYPSTEPGPFGIVSLSPGFFEQGGAIAGWGPRLASHGFVTIIINTSNLLEDPSARSTEQRQALTYLVNQGNNSASPLFGKVDGNRRAVGGHSMGGGASLISAQADHSIRAVMPLAPWNTSTDFSGIVSPTLVFACQNDTVAPVNQHASPFYNSIPASTPKEYLSIAGGDHFCADTPTAANSAAGKFAVAFLKRFIDQDTRYDPWTCGPSRPTAGSVLNEVRSTCPF